MATMKPVEPVKKSKSGLRWFYKIPLYLVVTWALGFGFYLLKVPTPQPASDHPKADAIVVLTGDKNRLNMGLELLKAGLGDRMLLSGVHPTVKPTELAALTGADQALFACCIDLGKEAANTIGNVTETRKWRQSKNIRGLLLVTSDYHMPRALLLFSQMDPEGVYYAAPTSSQAPFGFYLREYNKYLITLLDRGAENATGKALLTDMPATKEPAN